MNVSVTAGNTTKMGKKSLEDAYRRWKERLLSRPADEGGAACKTSSDIELRDLYFPAESEGGAASYQEKLGFPGEYPFTRGVQPTMYRGRLWTMRQYAGFGTAEESNKRFHYLLSQGTTGLSIAFDLPTQMGRDSDHALAKGEVGRVGVAIDTLDDMEILFKGIALDQVSTSMTINATAHILLALYLMLAKKQNIAWKKLRGTVQNDVLKEYIARGTYIYPPAPALKIVTDVFEFCRTEVPEWNTISISGYHIREAGSTAVQEVALTLANGIAYVEAALARGLAVDSFAPRLTFFFNCHNNFLEEVAKFRAARRMWGRIMKERFKAKVERSWMLKFHTQTAGSTLTAQQPQVNIVRTGLQALAAVFGGTQSLHTNAYDEALGLPTEPAALLALRTQQVIAYESGVPEFVDALGGSYAVESLTDEIETRAAELIAKIDALGGMVRAIERGFPQREIEDAAYRYQHQVEQGTQKIIGVNAFSEDGGEGARVPVSVLKVDPALEEAQRKRLGEIKARRNAPRVAEVLKELDESVASGANIMPSLCRTVEERASIGEISDVLRRRFGEYRQGA